MYKEIDGFSNYLCSNCGNVKSKRYNKPLKGNLNSAGYLRVQIGNSLNKKFIHRLVATTFLGTPKSVDYVVNHKDGNKLNNNSDNLEWCTRSENDLHAFNSKLRSPMKGEKHHNSKLTKKGVIEIRKLLSNGYNCTYISGIYKVNRKTISDIKNKRTWND